MRLTNGGNCLSFLTATADVVCSDITVVSLNPLERNTY